LQEEEEAKIPPQTPAVKSKTLNASETPSTSPLDELLDPLIDLVDLAGPEDQEDQKNHQYPLLISFPSSQQES
jgi:hypothetical protein